MSSSFFERDTLRLCEERTAYWETAYNLEKESHAKTVKTNTISKTTPACWLLQALFDLIKVYLDFRLLNFPASASFDPQDLMKAFLLYDLLNGVFHISEVLLDYSEGWIKNGLLSEFESRMLHFQRLQHSVANNETIIKDLSSTLTTDTSLQLRNRFESCASVISHGQTLISLIRIPLSASFYILTLLGIRMYWLGDSVDAPDLYYWFGWFLYLRCLNYAAFIFYVFVHGFFTPAMIGLFRLKQTWQRRITRRPESISKTTIRCALCVNLIHPADAIIELPCRFAHSFHSNCIANSLDCALRCPRCQERFPGG